MKKLLMKIYVFGNRDDNQDNVAFRVMERLEEENKSPFSGLRLDNLLYKKEGMKKIEFVEVKPNEDLPFENKEDVILMDGVAGLKEVSLIEDLDNLSLSPKNSVHDFDLGFQLKYLRKLGKIGIVKIIGLPMEKEIGEREIKKIVSLLHCCIIRRNKGKK